ncbi:MAG: glycosyltransferase [Solirubrobacteraceae bacterium]
MRALHLIALGLLAWTHVGWGLFLRVARAAGLGRVTEGGAVGEARNVSASSGPTAAPPPDVTLAGGDATRGPGEPARAAIDAGATPPFGLRVPPRVAVVVAAYTEESSIATTVAGLRDQAWPGERPRIVVACDGSPDATADRARDAGADLVLELPRGGKHRAQDTAVARLLLGDAPPDVLVFSDANTRWEPDALARLVAAFDEPEVGYACGRVTFVRQDGATNQEGAYWRAEMALRARESDWWSVSAGNGAIYAVRAALWPRLRTDIGHDLSLPHQIVRAGYVAVDVPTARATEPMVPSLEGEWRRKRRMMNQVWNIVLAGGPDDGPAGGVLDPRGLPPAYVATLASHRWLRYASPFLHVGALLAGAGAASGARGSRATTERCGPGARRGAGGADAGAGRGGAGRGRSAAVLHRALLAAHLAVGVGAAAASVRPSRPLLLCRYYVLMTASIAAGLLDRIRHGTPRGWDAAEGTRADR